MMLALLFACATSAAPPSAPEPSVPLPREPLPAEASLAEGPNLAHVCDASAGLWFHDALWVADDENNDLRRYDRGGTYLDERALLPKQKDEIDLEGVTRTSNGVWWIASHDRGKGTKPQTNRQHLILMNESGDVLQDRSDLLTLFATDSVLGPLVAATTDQTSKATDGFSIEALDAAPAGLLIGLRAPVVDGKALLVTLADPTKEASVQRVAMVDLGGLGFRSLERHKGQLYAIAGPADDKGAFTLFRLTESDDSMTAEAIPLDFGTLRPEGLVSIDDALLVLSDDGKLELDGTHCKKLPVEHRRARTAWIQGLE